MDVLGAHQPLPVAPSYSDSDLDRVPPVTLSAGHTTSFLSAPVPRLPSSPRRRAAASSIGLPLCLRGMPPRRAGARARLRGTSVARYRDAAAAPAARNTVASALRLPPTPPPRLQQLLQLLDAATPVPRRCADRGTLLSTRLGKHFSFYTTPL